MRITKNAKIIKMTVMKDIIVIGSSGHAKVVVDVLETEGMYRVAGLIDPYRKRGERAFGHEIRGSVEDVGELCKRHGIGYVFIAIGDNWVRHNMYQKIVSTCPGIVFATAVHPSAIIAKKVVIGNGSVVMAGVVVNNYTRIGAFCIINTSASIDHDCYLEDYSSVAPSVCLGGNVRIGKYSAVSIGAVVSHRVEIGQHTIVGAGSTVLADIPDQVLAYGTPARIIRKRETGEEYL